jgi:hypothetical protein
VAVELAVLVDSGEGGGGCDHGRDGGVVEEGGGEGGHEVARAVARAVVGGSSFLTNY